MATCNTTESAVRWRSGVDRSMSLWMHRIAILAVLASTILLPWIDHVALICLAVSAVFLFTVVAVDRASYRRFLRHTDHWWLQQLQLGANDVSSTLDAECRVRLSAGWRRNNRGVALPEAISAVLTWIETQGSSLAERRRRAVVAAVSSAIVQGQHQIPAQELRPSVAALSRIQCTLDRGRMRPSAAEDR